MSVGPNPYRTCFASQCGCEGINERRGNQRLRQRALVRPSKPQETIMLKAKLRMNERTVYCVVGIKGRTILITCLILHLLPWVLMLEGSKSSVKSLAVFSLKCICVHARVCTGGR